MKKFLMAASVTLGFAAAAVLASAVLSKTSHQAYACDRPDCN